MEQTKTIVQEHTKNFETLRRAFKDGAVCLMECTEKATGEKVAVICTVFIEEDGEYQFTPFARFFNGNPYELLTSPMEEEETP
jgi:hypothetical protein